MILRYLKLENFLSHESTTIELPAAGLFFLSGESGAGKSSLIIDATAYALFGPAAVTRAKRSEELVRSGASSMQVAALFEFADEKLLIERGLNPQPEARLYLVHPDRSELIAEGAQEVNRAINKRLGGMNWRQFFAAFVARQSEIAMLTQLRGNERKNLVHRMLGMRELEKSSEIVSQRLRRSKAEVDQLQVSVGNFDPERAEAEISENANKLAAAEAKGSALDRQIETDNLELKSLREEEAGIASARQALARIPELEQRRPGLSAELDQAKATARRATEIQLRLADRDQIDLDLVRAEDRVSELRDDYRQLDRQQTLLAKLDELEAEPVQSISYPEITGEIAKIRADRISRLERIADLDASLERIGRDGSCYACDRDFASGADRDQVVSNLSEQVTKLGRANAAAESRLDQLDKLEPLVQRSDQVRREKDRLGEALGEEIQLSSELGLSDLAEAGAEAAVELQRLSRAQAELGLLERDYDPDAQRRAGDLKSELNQLDADLKSLQVSAALADPEQIAKIEAGINQLQISIGSAAARRDELGSSVSSLKDVRRALDKEYQGRSRELKQLGDLRHQSTVTELVSVCLKGFQKQLADDIRPALEEIGSEMLAAVSGGKHVAMHIDGSYEITIEDDGGARRRAALLSGGEQIRANICLRLALTRLVSQRTGIPVGFLIFDEPLPSQDPGHIERIMQLLYSLRGFYQQQFLISHVGDLRSADELDYVVEFDGKSVELTNA